MTDEFETQKGLPSGSRSSSKASKSMAVADTATSVDENGKRIRYDKFGNKITTVIGTFSVANRKNLIKSKKASMSHTSDTGGAESPLKGEDRAKKPQRHRISFADDMMGQDKLSDVHYIESYKKYNQEFYIDNQVQGCCTIFWVMGVIGISTSESNIWVSNLWDYSFIQLKLMLS